jgi:lipopolysaccharide/colanic/teichoic acid biosynthesis glycosyltransferase
VAGHGRTAIAIKLNSKGPVLFMQKRHGFNNEVINVFKFRSMYTDQCDPTARAAVTKGDPRVTRVGRFIRKTSIDELPQFFNVLRGDLSLVGPRPHAVVAAAHDRLFAEVVDGYFARHRVKPGVTGWAQISGWRGEIDNDEKIKQRTACDLYYIENWSLLFDSRSCFSPRSGFQYGKRLLTSATLPVSSAFQPQRAAMSLMASLCVAFGVFLSGFVINEPAPYELFLVVLIAIWALFGLKLSRHIAPLISLYVVFNIGGMFSILTMDAVKQTPMYIAVSLFLAFTAMFFAAIIEADQRRLLLIFRAYVVAAIITAMLGILGYLRRDTRRRGVYPVRPRDGSVSGPQRVWSVSGAALALPDVRPAHGHAEGSAFQGPGIDDPGAGRLPLLLPCGMGLAGDQYGYAGCHHADQGTHRRLPAEDPGHVACSALCC